MRRFRPVVAIIAIAAMALVAQATVATADPHSPDTTPTIAQVQRELGELALKNTQLVEKYDQAQTQVQRKQAEAKKAQQVAAAANTAFETARRELGAAAAAEYEGGSFSATGALLTSSSGASYLDKLATLKMISSHTAQIVSHLVKVKKELDTARKSAADLLATATTKRDALNKQKSDVQKQIDKYRKTLEKLDAQQRAAYQRSVNPAVSQSTVDTLKHTLPKAGSAAATQAVKFALAQVGKPYVFGAAGPNTYDCSGLTMRAWGSAGVSLPHSAADQYNYGTHVSFSELQPGDLLFYYHPISHVTIYIGDGMMVSAPQSGEDVSVVPASPGGNFVGATRL